MSIQRAQTITGLLKIVNDYGYSLEDSLRVRKAYQVALQCFTSKYLDDGTPHICHDVGVASLAASFKVPIDVVVSGLLHNVYQESRFKESVLSLLKSCQHSLNARHDNYSQQYLYNKNEIWYGTKNIATSIRLSAKDNRQLLRDSIGKTPEEYIYRFSAMRWWEQSILAIQNDIETLDVVDQQVVLLKILDNLEHHLAFREFFIPSRRQLSNLSAFKKNGKMLAVIANKLGYSSLSSHIDELHTTANDIEIDPQIFDQVRQNHWSFTTVPVNYRQKLSGPLYQIFSHTLENALNRYQSKV